MPDEKIYDLGAFIKREKAKEPRWKFRIGGKTFSIPQRACWPDDALRALQDHENPDFVLFAESILGDRYADFIAAGGTAAALFEGYSDAQSATPGESKASTRS